jgi:hypothetical protein
LNSGSLRECRSILQRAEYRDRSIRRLVKALGFRLKERLPRRSEVPSHDCGIRRGGACGDRRRSVVRLAEAEREGATRYVGRLTCGTLVAGVAGIGSARSTSAPVRISSVTGTDLQWRQWVDMTRSASSSANGRYLEAESSSKRSDARGRERQMAPIV